MWGVFFIDFDLSLLLISNKNSFKHVIIMLLNNNKRGDYRVDLVTKVKLFIAQYHSLYESGKVQYTLNRKSQNFLNEINMTVKAMSAYVYENLRPELYYQGPSAHHRLPDFQVMVFEMSYEDRKLYVKLAIGEIPISDDKTDGITIYMSFHPEEAEMNLPLQEGDKNDKIRK